MLSEILSKDECAKCRICCCFDSTDIWEAPIITKEKQDEIIRDYNPKQKFVQKDGNTILNMKKEKGEDLYYCSMLSHETGCIMKDKKPFDCKIWPLRIMLLNGTLVITLSPVCPVVKTRPLDKLCEVASKLAPALFAEAEKNPQIVKPYINGYPILAVKEN